MVVNPVFRRLKQEDGQEFQANLEHTARLASKIKNIWSQEVPTHKYTHTLKMKTIHIKREKRRK